MQPTKTLRTERRLSNPIPYTPRRTTRRVVSGESLPTAPYSADQRVLGYKSNDVGLNPTKRKAPGSGNLAIRQSTLHKPPATRVHESFAGLGAPPQSTGLGTPRVIAKRTLRERRSAADASLRIKQPDTPVRKHRLDVSRHTPRGDVPLLTPPLTPSPSLEHHRPSQPPQNHLRQGVPGGIEDAELCDIKFVILPHALQFMPDAANESCRYQRGCQRRTGLADSHRK